MIKKKYKLNTNPSVINFEVNPSSLWVIYNTNIEESNGSNIIFLNYHKYLKIIFKKSNDVFKMQNYYQNIDVISKIIFLGDKKIRDKRLRDVVTSQEARAWKFLSKSVFLKYILLLLFY